jgi:hypothetical protein
MNVKDFPIYCRKKIEIVNCKNCNNPFPRWKCKHRPTRDRRMVAIRGNNFVNCSKECTKEYSRPSSKNFRKRSMKK